MSQQQLDARGEAHEALGTAVASYGQRVLDDPHILGNLVADLLPDLPRERSLLVAGAEAGIAAEMTQHVQEQHIDPDTAVQLVARTLAERRAIDQAASIWVATEYAQALGYQVRPFASLAPPGPAEMHLPAPPTLTAMPGQPGPGQPPAAAPVSPQVPPMPYQTQSWPPQAGSPQAVPPQAVPPQAGPPPAGPPQSWPPQPQSWPPAQPPGGTGRASRISSTRSLVAAGAAVGLVAAYLVVAVVAHIVPFAKAHPAPTPRPTPPPARHSPILTPTPTLAPGVTPLAQLMPGDISDPATQCQPVKKPYDWQMPGLVSATSCGDQNLPNGYVQGYQLDNRADYQTAWRNFNSWWAFDSTSAGQTCPPSGSSGQGETPWFDNKFGFPQIQGQVLECEMGSRSAPVYVWTMPTQDTFLIAVGAAGSSFKALNDWWENDSNPASKPSPVAS